MKKHNVKTQDEEDITIKIDPYLGLKHIAYCRTGLSKTTELTSEILLSFAKWQICKARRVLWNDPVWDSYTQEEILIEFFSISFDLDPKTREVFEKNLMKPREAEYAWFDKMEAKALAEAKAKAKAKEESPKEPIDKIKGMSNLESITEDEAVEFEDDFGKK